MRQVSDFLFVSYAFLNETIYLFLVVFDIVNRKNFALSIPTEETQVLVSLASELFVNLVHNDCTFALLREQDITFDFLDDLH